MGQAPRSAPAPLTHSGIKVVKSELFGSIFIARNHNAAVITNNPE
jgi:3-isopropylmalate dehydratase small subunit